MLLPTVAKFCKNPLRGFLKRGGGQKLGAGSGEVLEGTRVISQGVRDHPCAGYIPTSIRLFIIST